MRSLTSVGNHTQVGLFTNWADLLGFAAAIAATYFLAARTGLALVTASEDVAVFWPASGIAAALLITLGRRSLLPVVIGVMIGTVGANILDDRSLLTAVLKGLCNAGEAILIAWLIERWLGQPFAFKDLHCVFGFLAAASIATATSAIGGAATMALTHTSAPFWEIWAAWFLSDWVGVVVVAPVLIELGQLRRELHSRSEFIEGVGVLLLAAVASVFVAIQPTNSWLTFSPSALALPPLLWMAARCKPTFPVAGAFVASTAIITATTYGLGRFGDAAVPMVERVKGAQLAVMVMTLFTLVLIALFAERRRNEAAVTEGKNRLQLALDAAELGVWTVDLETRRFDNDEQDRRNNGHDLASPPKSLAQARSIIHPEDLSSLDAAFAAPPGRGDSHKAEYRLAAADRFGLQRWVAVEGKIQRDSNGKPVRLFGVTRDITRRKRDEQALVERSTQLELAGKLALVGSFTFDIGTGRMQVSPGYAAIHGLPEGTVETDRAAWRTRVHPDDLPGLEAHLQNDLNARRSDHRCEYRIRSSSDMRWIEARSFISYDQDGAAPRIVGVNIDVTERKKADLALAERTTQLALAGKAALVGSFAYDCTAGRMDVSDGFAAMHGLPQGTTTVGREEWLRLIHPEDRTMVEQLRSRALRQKLTEYGGDHRIIRSGGEVRWMDARLFASYDSDGRAQRVVGVNIDITERKRAEDHQRAMRAELDHRVKNVLGIVCAIITQTQDANSSHADFVAALDLRIRSLASTHEMLSQNNWCGVSLAEIVRREFAPYAGGKVDFGGPSVTLKAEAAQTVAMALHELTTNAAKYGALSQWDGRVTLRWQLRNGSAGQLAIAWQEVGGPAVSAPKQTGYGTSIIRELIPFELDGTVDLTFARTGLKCRLEIPRVWIGEDAEASGGVDPTPPAPLH